MEVKPAGNSLPSILIGELWKSCIHMLVGLAFFALILVACVGLNHLTRLMTDVGIGGSVFPFTLKIVQYLLAAMGLLLYMVLVAHVVIRSIRRISHYQNPEAQDEEPHNKSLNWGGRRARTD